MPAPRRWDRSAAAADYAAGASLTAIAKRAGVARQAVAKAAEREGWQRTAEGAALAATATGKRLLKPVTPADHRIVSEGKRSMLAMTRIIDVLRAGGTRAVTAATVAIDAETLRRWALEDGAFARLMDQAEGEKTFRRIGHLEAAAERGDTPAARFLLERDPASRADFGAPGIALGGDGGPALVLNLVLAPGALAVLGGPSPAAPAVIEHEPSKGDALTMAETTTPEVIRARSLAQMASDAFQAARQKVADLRLARARGDAAAPSAADLAKARDAAELAEDRATIAAQEAAEAEARASEEARRAAIRARRAELTALHDETRALDARLFSAAEEMAAAIAALAEQTNHLTWVHPELAGRWNRTRIAWALEAFTAPWPLNLPLPTQRPIPYRPASVRALHPDRCAALLNEFLPIPADPDALPGATSRIGDAA